ncbi:hypothetical protein ACX0G9_21825 [Flavitalea flava]
MGIVEYLEKLRKDDNFEDGYRQGFEAQGRRIVQNFLKVTDLPLEKIASLVGVSLEMVKEISITSIIEQLAGEKRKEILEECHASSYREDYSERYTRNYVQSYKVGLQDGFELVIRRFVEGLLKNSSHTSEEISFLAGVTLETVKKIKSAL